MRTSSTSESLRSLSRGRSDGWESSSALTLRLSTVPGSRTRRQMHCHEGRIMERWWRRMYQCKSSQKRRSVCCSHRRWRRYSRKIARYMSPSQMNLMMLGRGTARDYGEMAASHGCLQMYERVFSATNMTSLLVRTVESQSRSLEDYQNEIALLRDRLELYEKERKAPVEEQDFGDEAQ